MFVQQFILKHFVEAFDEGVLHGIALLDEVQQDVAVITKEEAFAGKFDGPITQDRHLPLSGLVSPRRSIETGQLTGMVPGRSKRRHNLRNYGPLEDSYLSFSRA